MLAAIGVSSRAGDLRPPDPRGGASRPPARAARGARPSRTSIEHLRELAARNTSAEDELSFLGAGMYDHYVPALIDMLMERSEFLTPYTPYQPEISQGGLQVMFEYQTAISELTGLPVSNASTYEGPSAVAAAGVPGQAPQRPPPVRRQRRTAPAHDPDAAHVRTRLRHGGRRGAPAGRAAGGVTDPEAWARAIDADTSAAIFAQPNFYGAVEDAEALSAAAKAAGGAPGANGNGAERSGGRSWSPRSTRSRSGSSPPGDCGVDVAVGEGQPLGNRLDFGGPSFGLFAAREEYLRRMPGRIAGETVDVDGRRGFVLTLQTREQHIRREKATSNICTAQALNALAGVVYLTWLGRRGIVELGELLLARTHYARETLAALSTASRSCTTSRSCASSRCGSTPTSPACAAAAPQQGVNPGADLQALTGRAEDRGGLLVAITERRSRADIDRLAEVLGAALAAAERSPPARRCAREHDRRQPPARRPRDRGPSRPDPPGTPVARRRCSASARARSSRRARPGAARSCARSSTCPTVGSEELLPARFRRAEPPRAARGLRAGDRAPLRRPLQAQLRPRLGLLPARLVHDEAQPAPARARRRRCPGTRACTRCRTPSARRARSS